MSPSVVRRRLVWAVPLSLAAIGLLVALGLMTVNGSGARLSTAEVENWISTHETYWDGKAHSVVCPDNIPMRKGHVVTCTFVSDQVDGQNPTAIVTQYTDNGDFTFRVNPESFRIPEATQAPTISSGELEAFANAIMPNRFWSPQPASKEDLTTASVVSIDPPTPSNVYHRGAVLLYGTPVDIEKSEAVKARYAWWISATEGEGAMTWVQCGNAMILAADVELDAVRQRLKEVGC